jgi:NADH-quinone oxidoreductase subunit M
MIVQHLLTWLIIVPVLAAAVILLLPGRYSISFKAVTLGASVIQLLLLAFIIVRYDPNVTGFQLMEQASWINIDLGTWGQFNAEYLLALDGLSIVLVALSVVILFIAVISSWTVASGRRGYFSLLLILNAAVIGTFCALDLLLFYLFFEFMLLPMYFLIGIWGGPRREYASIKFFLYTLLGSIFILIVIIGLYLSSAVPDSENVHTLSMIQLSGSDSIKAGSILHPDTAWDLFGLAAREWAFIFLLIGFGIKLPMIPLHTWLPDAHVEASTPVSVILAALLLKIGGYGLLRMAYPIFPDAAAGFSWLVSGMGMLTIIYGALNALASKDLKRLIAYSSVSHMGFVLLGVGSGTVEGITGAVFQMGSHGLISAMLFLIAGVLYDRTGDRMIANYSGLAVRMPMYTAFVLVAFFAALGLPGLSGFVGEVLVFLGAFKSDLIPVWIPVVSVGGLVLAAGYCLWTIQRMFFGVFALRVPNAELYDIHRREKLMLVTLALLILVCGIFPQIVIQFINSFAVHLADVINLRVSTQ